MSDNKDSSPAAFPSSDEYYTNRGMSLRDWLAGQAIAGILTVDVDFKSCAECAYRLADAMLEARRPASSKQGPG